MGSFNASCSISRTPILYGQDVRLVFLITNKSCKIKKLFDGQYINPWDNFSIIGYPIKAKYDDYGIYEIDENTLPAKIALAEFNSYQIKDINGLVLHDSLTLSNVQEFIRCGNFMVGRRGVSEHDYYCSIMPIHESVYQVLMNTTLNNYNESYEPIVMDLSKIIDEKNKSIKDILNKTYENNMILLETLKSNYANIVGNDFIHDIFDNHSIVISTYQTRRSSFKQSAALNKSMKYSTDYDEIARCEAEYDVFVEAIEKYNITLCPSILSGQEYDYSACISFLENITNAVKNLSEENEENEEFVSTERLSTTWQEVNYSSIRQQLEQWFTDDNEIFTDMLNFKKDHAFDVKAVIDLNNTKYEFLADLFQNREIPLHVYLKK